MKREKQSGSVEKMSGKVLILEARFYTEIADHMASGAIAVLEKAGLAHERLEVPGSLELPFALQMAAKSGQYDAYVVLGCVIRGDTSHYDIVCNESSRGVYDVVRAFDLPLGNAILTVENLEQAYERADTERLDKGGDAARAAITTLAIKRKFAA